MHEVSIAANIIQIAEEEVKKAKARKVDELYLEIGELSGVVIESLSFALDVAKANTSLKDAAIHIEQIAPLARCLNCGHEFNAEDFYVCCPKCKEFHLDIVRGRELKIKSLVVS